MHSTVSATSSSTILLLVVTLFLAFTYDTHPRFSRVARRSPSVIVISGPCKLAEVQPQQHALDGVGNHVEYHLAVGGYSIFSIHIRHPPEVLTVGYALAECYGGQWALRISWGTAATAYTRRCGRPSRWGFNDHLAFSGALCLAFIGDTPRGPHGWLCSCRVLRWSVGLTH